jgi:NAD(P)-dependent dehydrogenase (short-subunit alcohol dehydrogenase family)
MNDDPITLGIAGKTALVTGGASGIGLVTAKLLGSLGARVVIADLDQDALGAAQDQTGAVATTSGDIADDTACKAMVQEAERHLGKIDILIHAAGIGDDKAAAETLDIDAWQRVMDVDLRGTFLINRAVAARMLPHCAGAIVNVSSICGFGAFPGRSAYGAAKASVNHLTQTLACEWGPRGLRVSAIAPAYTRTPMVADLIARQVFDPDMITARTPLGRLAEPEEMARAAVFLASDWASYITGTVLIVDAAGRLTGRRGRCRDELWRSSRPSRTSADPGPFHPEMEDGAKPSCVRRQVISVTRTRTGASVLICRSASILNSSEPDVQQHRRAHDVSAHVKERERARLIIQPEGPTTPTAQAGSG